MSHKPYTISIPKNLISSLPLVEYDAPIHVIDTMDRALEVLDKLSKEKIVGFDTETRPSFTRGRRYNVALIQISTLKCSYLFRVNKLGIFPELTEFIENDSVVKVGLSLKDDFFVMHKVSEFLPHGFIDLQDYVKKFGITDASLQRIFGIVFNERISKAQRLTNWEAQELTPAQQHYAAVDAWACLKVYLELSEGRFDAENSPYKVYAEDETEIAKEVKQ